MKEYSHASEGRPLLEALGALRDVPAAMGDADLEARRRDRIAAHVLATQASLDRSARRRNGALVWLAAALSLTGWLAFLLRPAPSASTLGSSGHWLPVSNTAAAAMRQLVSEARPVDWQKRSFSALAAPTGLQLVSGELHSASKTDATWVATERARVRLPNQVEVELAQDTVVRVRTGNPGAPEELELVQGKVRVLSASQPGARAQIRTQTIRIEGQDATFSVSFLANDARVTVDSGSVRLKRKGWSRRLEAGQAWQEPGDGASTPDTLGEQNQMLETALLAKQRGLHSLALRKLDELLSAYPLGPLSENARAERFRVLRSAGDHERARGAAQAYLLAHPSGFARAEAERLITPER